MRFPGFKTSNQFANETITLHALYCTHQQETVTVLLLFSVFAIQHKQCKLSSWIKLKKKHRSSSKMSPSAGVSLLDEFFLLFSRWPLRPVQTGNSWTLSRLPGDRQLLESSWLLSCLWKMYAAASWSRLRTRFPIPDTGELGPVEELLEDWFP